MERKDKIAKLKHAQMCTPVPDDTGYGDILRTLSANMLMSEYKVLGGMKIADDSDDEDDSSLCEHEWQMSMLMDHAMRNATANEANERCEHRNIVGPNVGQASGLLKEQHSRTKVEVLPSTKVEAIPSTKLEPLPSIMVEVLPSTDKKVKVVRNRTNSTQSNASEASNASKTRKCGTKKEEKENEAKLLKKKLKKQRQKEKKMCEKLDTNEKATVIVETGANVDEKIAVEIDTNEDAKAVTETGTKEDITVVAEASTQGAKNILPPVSSPDKKMKESKKSVSRESETSNDNDSAEKDDNESEDFDFINNIPAFMSVAMKKLPSTKLEKVTKKAISTDTSKSSNSDSNKAIYSNMECHSENDDEEFTFVKGKRTKQQSNSHQLSDFCANRAIEYIMKNNISLATKYLSEAIENDPSQIQHYVNRSFCYLRSKRHSLALADAQYAVKNSTDTKVLLKAKTILAQAFCGMKDYEHAERTLEECLSLAPQNPCVERELLRIRILELMCLGFPERISIKALKDANTVLEAIDIITKKYADSEDNTCDTNSTCIYDDNDVYYSDDDDTLSNTSVMSQIAHKLSVSSTT